MGDSKPDGFLDNHGKGLHTNVEDVPLALMQTDPAESGDDSDYNANIDKGQRTNFEDVPLGQVDPAESGDDSDNNTNVDKGPHNNIEDVPLEQTDPAKSGDDDHSEIMRSRGGQRHPLMNQFFSFAGGHFRRGLPS